MWRSVTYQDFYEVRTLELSPQQVLHICKGDAEIAGHFNALLTIIQKQSEQIEALNNRVSELERQLGQNSNNSSKPPSSDGFRKPTNLRTPGGKKGAPKGHKGNTLRFAQQPDDMIVHTLTRCAGCLNSLEAVESQGYERRQVFDLPPPRIWVTEHRVEKKCCPYCNLQQSASFPARIQAPTQYGDGFAAWTCYLHAYQMLPLERIAQLFSDLTGYRPSEATLLSFLQTMSDSLEGAEQTIRAQLLQKPVAHADETGCRVEGKTQWVHVMSDANWTLLGIHPKRGSKAMDALGAIPAYKGTLVHDCMSGYFREHFFFDHALCNAHLLRECQGIAENDGHEWATRMKELLQESWKLAQTSRQDNIPLSEAAVQAIQQRYDDILEDGKQEWAKDIVRAKTGTRGRKIKSKAGNLGERLETHKESILRFLWDARVPFDNNQAERDLRMVKVKQKVSGAFRTESGAKNFARMRSVISTLLKQQLPVLSSLTNAIRGQFSFNLT